MDWTVYSLGDSAYLEQILNAVAMIVGTGEFTVMVKIGFVFGILLVIFQAVAQGGRGIDVGKVLVAWIVFSMVYGTGARVLVEDAYSGNVRVVDNVPLGVAAVGSIVSQVGYQVTRIFETAFSTPEMTQYGFVGTLQRLGTVRDAARDLIGLGNANAPVAGSDFEQSWYNYIKECTMVGVELGRIAPARLMTSQDPMNALRFASAIYHTEILVGATPRVLSCTAAHDALKTYTEQQFIPNFQALLGGLLRASPADPKLTAAQVDNEIDVALGQLAQAASDAVRYMKAVTLLPVYQQAVVGREVDSLQGEYAVMLSQAMHQRDTQWAAQQSLFEQFVRPLMTFIEGFVYAVTPLMAFLIAMGPLGIRLAGRYVLMVLWIQLWLPLMAVINLYVLMSAAGDMDAIQTLGTAAANSFAGVERLYLVIQHYLATGGMLASSIPAIALMLVYGSAVTATHLAGRLQASDGIDEKLPTPDVARQEPAFVNRSMHERTALGGAHTMGADELLATVGTGAALSQVVSSSQRNMEQASERFQSQLGSRLSSAFSRDMSFDSMERLGRSMASGQTRTAAAIEKLAEDYRRDFGATDGKEYALASIATGIANGALRFDASTGSIRNMMGEVVSGGESLANYLGSLASAGGAGTLSPEAIMRGGGDPSTVTGRQGARSGTGAGASLHLGASAGLRNTASSTRSDRTSDAYVALIGAQHNDELRADLQNRMAHDLSDGRRSGFEHDLSDQDYQDLSRSAEDVRTAAREYATVQQSANSFQLRTNTSGTVATRQIAASEAAYDALTRAVGRHHDALALRQDLLPRMQRLLPGDERAASVAAGMQALAQTGHQDAILGVLSAMGFGTGMADVDPFASAGMRERGPSFGAVQRRAGSAGVGAGARAAEAVASGYRARAVQVDERLAAGQGAIGTNFDTGRERTEDAYAAGAGQTRGAATPAFRTRIMGADAAPSVAETLAGGTGNLVDSVLSQGRAAAGGALVAAGRYTARMDDWMAHRAQTDPGDSGWLHGAVANTKAFFSAGYDYISAGRGEDGARADFGELYARYEDRYRKTHDWSSFVQSAIGGMMGAAAALPGDLRQNYDELLEAYQGPIHQAAYRHARGMGLTDTQSAIYAQATVEGLSGRAGGALGFDSGEMGLLRTRLYDEYRDEDGVVDRELADKVFSMTANAAMAGNEWSQSTLVSVRNLNGVEAAARQ